MAYVPKIKFYLAGVDITEHVIDSGEIEDALNAEPNRLTFRVSGMKGLVPQEGQQVVVRRDASVIEFAGNVLQVEHSFQELRENIIYTLSCQDRMWEFDKKLVTQKWSSISATTIATNIVTASGSGFTTTNVVGGLATIAEFECILEKPSSALSRLAALIGGNYYVDYGNPLTATVPDVHFFLTEVTDAPNDLTDSEAFSPDLRHMGDLSQVRTQVKGIGVGTQTLEDMAISATSIPLVDSSMFSASGGSALSGSNVLTYTSRHLGSIASQVSGSIIAPVGAPTAAVTSGVVGPLVGAKTYKIAFGSPQGETPAGPASNTATGVAFTVPTAGLITSVANVAGLLVGVYLYVVTYLTSLGETSAGASFGSTATAWAAPGSVTINVGSTIGRLIGQRYYRFTHHTAYGETEGGTANNRTAVAVSTPSAPGVAAVSSTIGKLIGAYSYKVSVATDFGETAASTAGTRTAVAQTGPSAPTNSVVDDGPLVGVYQTKISFVSAVGETMGTATGNITASIVVAAGDRASAPGGSGYDFRTSFRGLFGETSRSTNSSYYSNIGNGTFGTPNNEPATATIQILWRKLTSESIYRKVAEAPVGSTITTAIADPNGDIEPSSGTMGQYLSITNIPTGPTGTLSRRVWRTKAGGSTFFLVGEIPDNSTTTFTDKMPDSAMSVSPPVQNLNGEQHTISSIATGPTGTTRRDIWRTEAGGSTHYYLGSLFDNSTTSFTDNYPDSALDRSRPAPSATTIGDKHSLTIPTGPTGTIGRTVYATKMGGSIYYKLVEIPDNVTTAYTDDSVDADLGTEVAPTVSTAGGQQFSLYSLPIGQTGTLARNIWRTVAGGSSFRFVGQLTNNTTTVFVDNVPDTNLGDYVPLVNTAGASKITLTSIPLGGAGVTERIVYRIDADGAYKYVDTIPDNTTTTYIDEVPDESLGRVALTVGSVGASAGATSLELLSAAGFPTLGWLKADNQLVYYTGVSGNTLTGIPASGVGSLLSAVKGGATAITAPFLSGVSGVLYAIDRGAELRIFVTRNDSAAQTALAALESGDGIRVSPIDDSSILTVPALEAACDAELAGYKSRLRQITFSSRDVKLRSGKTLVLNQSSPFGTFDTVAFDVGAFDVRLGVAALSGNFLIQRVVTSQMNVARDVNPLRTVTAAPVLVTFKDVLRRSSTTIA